MVTSRLFKIKMTLTLEEKKQLVLDTLEENVPSMVELITFKFNNRETRDEVRHCISKNIRALPNKIEDAYVSITCDETNNTAFVVANEDFVVTVFIKFIKEMESFTYSWSYRNYKNVQLFLKYGL